MEYKALQRLTALQELNADRRWQNRDLYRLMYKEDLYIVAYERIRSAPGNMTEGSDGETIDGWSLEKIQEIITAMKDESYQFKPVRRREIPKPGSDKKRKLGIPSFRDKLVQEVMRMILEAIYDSPKGPHFSESSHGFRPNRGCHTALNEYRRNWSAVNWIIEGDIKSCFDDIDHTILIQIMRKKIQDERFLNLVRKLLNAGIMDEFRMVHDSLAGTPQGGIVSPLLANIYLHELDEKVEEIRAKVERGTRKKQNPEYKRLDNAKKKALHASGGIRTDEVKAIEKQMREIPSVMENDPDFLRVKYLRYADDWIVGVSGPRTVAEEIKEWIKSFLDQELHLKLSEEKTVITQARNEWAKFLGTLLRIGRGDGHGNVLRDHNYGDGRIIRKRSAGWQPVMYAPVDKLIAKLSREGFCDSQGFPTAKVAWSLLDPDQIVLMFSSINRGIQNYYRFCDNFGELRRIQYILHFSMAKTFAQKYKTSVRKIFTRYGYRDFRVEVGPEGKKRTVRFFFNTDWARKPNAFHKDEDSGYDIVKMWARLRTRSKLGMPCAVCGSEENVEMHHLRHIRKMGEKKLSGFSGLMAKLNRKQVPVCQDCHDAIHAGTYDGKKLSDLLYDPR